MKLSTRLNNEDRFRRDVESALEIVTVDEAIAWKKHPCTQAMCAALQADMCGVITTWLEGGYSDQDSVDSTAQKEAKARGIAQAMDDVLEMIEQIGQMEYLNNVN